MPDLPYAVPSESLNHRRLPTGNDCHIRAVPGFSKVFCRGGRLTEFFFIIIAKLSSSSRTLANLATLASVGQYGIFREAQLAINRVTYY